MTRVMPFAAALCTLTISALLAGCGGNDNSNSGPRVVATIAVPNSASPPFSFDIGYVDSGKYYLADRSNAAVDVVDTKSNTLVAQIKGNFTGIGASTDTSGPDGLVGIPGTNTLYAGDVNAVKILDVGTQQLVKTIPISTSGSRVDEGCYDPDDGLVMFSSPGESPPFATFISTKTQTVVSKLTFTDSSGLEACVYDPKGKNFIVNNDGTTANPDGEVNVIPAATVVAGAPAVTHVFPLGKCAPTGLDLGPNNDMIVGCDPAPGDPLITLILDRTTGATLATIPFGGVDQIAYDSVSNRYFLPARHYQTNKIAAASNFVPTLAIVDAASRSILTTLAIGNNAHSVAVDGATGQAYLPFAPGVAAFPNGGIQVVSTH
ncbi:hypothetical protein [Caballeronia humi]|uniref:Lipoprotein n=1 Tax=Caballeronia humi TaxID=326474 RepID=A0A158J7D6_9BURK|nr:hypothetical protein [Caballeronia humi]SAL64862.1 hypothetical protein AWB65_06100 [Caballeronia humi]